MTYQQVLDYINQWIVANGNNEITADVLRPVLVAILTRSQDVTGNTEDLSTAVNSNLVAAINSILLLIPPGSAGIKLFSGQVNPNTTPPPSYSYADFYMLTDTGNEPIQLYQFTGQSWEAVTYSGGGSIATTQEFTATDGNPKTFTLTGSKTAIQVHSARGYVPKSAWSQTGSVVTVNWDFFDGDDVDILVQ